MGLRERLFGSSKEPDFVRVAVARHQPEGELLISMLAGAGIPAYYGRTRGFDVPDMLAAGPRDILVPAHLELEARAMVQPILEDLENGADLETESADD
jgi:hypothetical protein